MVKVIFDFSGNKTKYAFVFIKMFIWGKANIYEDLLFVRIINLTEKNENFPYFLAKFRFFGRGLCA